MKKAQMPEVAPLEFLIRVVIALIVIVPTAMWIADLFRGTSKQAIDSYNLLIKTINEIVDGELGSLAFTMDPYTAIVAFSKDASEIRYLEAEEGILRPVGTFKRVSSCPTGTSCVCFCASQLQLEKNAEGKIPDNPTVTCEKGLSCQPLKNVQMPSKISIPELGLHVQKGDSLNYQPVIDDRQKELDALYSFEGGFIFSQEMRSGNIGYPSLFLTDAQVRLHQLTIERKGDEARFCFKSPCFPKEPTVST